MFPVDAAGLRRHLRSAGGVSRHRSREAPARLAGSSCQPRLLRGLAVVMGRAAHRVAGAPMVLRSDVGPLLVTSSCPGTSARSGSRCSSCNWRGQGWRRPRPARSMRGEQDCGLAEHCESPLSEARKLGGGTGHPSAEHSRVPLFPSRDVAAANAAAANVAVEFCRRRIAPRSSAGRSKSRPLTSDASMRRKLTSGKTAAYAEPP